MRTALLGIAALVLFGSSAARATTIFACGSGCIYDPVFGPFSQDYTVPADGRTHRWDLAFTSADPSTTVTWDAPTQVEAILIYNRGGGVFETVLGSDAVPFLFTQILAPTLTSYLVRAPANFDTCTGSVASAAPCAAGYHVWGNGTSLHVAGSAPLTITFTDTVVAEPRTWALLIAGFGATGVLLRCKRVRRELRTRTPGRSGTHPPAATNPWVPALRGDAAGMTLIG